MAGRAARSGLWASCGEVWENRQAADIFKRRAIRFSGLASNDGSSVKLPQGAFACLYGSERSDNARTLLGIPLATDWHLGGSLAGYVQNPPENRAIPPRWKTNPRNREMPVLLRSRTEQPHRLRDTRLELHDQTRQKIENKYVCPFNMGRQKGFMAWRRLVVGHVPSASARGRQAIPPLMEMICPVI